MPTSKSTQRTCAKGHQYLKSSDCPTCPICEMDRKPVNGFLATLAAPARRALERNNITTLQQLSNYSETALLKLHGIGKSSIPRLQNALKEQNLSFKK